MALVSLLAMGRALSSDAGIFGCLFPGKCPTLSSRMATLCLTALFSLQAADVDAGLPQPGEPLGLLPANK